MWSHLCALRIGIRFRRILRALKNTFYIKTNHQTILIKYKNDIVKFVFKCKIENLVQHNDVDADNTNVVSVTKENRII